MSPQMKFGIAGIIVAIVLWIVGVPIYVPLILIALAIAIPVAAYAMLNPAQRRRVRRMRGRKQLGG
jgi:multisubunit Na+/H+ antiporter MnhG subunit